MFKVGIALNGDISKDGQYPAVARQHFDLVTAQNECKFDKLQPLRGVYDFSECDKMKKFADDNGMVFRGHTIAWGAQTPAWFDGLSPADKKAALIDHINNVLPRYGNIAWDIANESIADDLKDGNWYFKNSVWYPDVPDFVTVAFKQSRAACPGCKLFYNDYGTGSMTGWEKNKADAVYALAK